MHTHTHTRTRTRTHRHRQKTHAQTKTTDTDTDTDTDTCSSRQSAVSYAQQRATLRMVYPPPPTTISGLPKLFMNSTHLPWPFIDKLNVPRRSPTSESAPHCTTHPHVRALAKTKKKKHWLLAKLLAEAIAY
jgi:hypothetical protein